MTHNTHGCARRHMKAFILQFLTVQYVHGDVPHLCAGKDGLKSAFGRKEDKQIVLADPTHDFNANLHGACSEGTACLCYKACGYDIAKMFGQSDCIAVQPSKTSVKLNDSVQAGVDSVYQYMRSSARDRDQVCSAHKLKRLDLRNDTITNTNGSAPARTIVKHRHERDWNWGGLDPEASMVLEASILNRIGATCGTGAVGRHFPRLISFNKETLVTTVVGTELPWQTGFGFGNSPLTWKEARAQVDRIVCCLRASKVRHLDMHHCKNIAFDHNTRTLSLFDFDIGTIDETPRSELLDVLFQNMYGAARSAYDAGLQKLLFRCLGLLPWQDIALQNTKNTTSAPGTDVYDTHNLERKAAQRAEGERKTRSMGRMASRLRNNVRLMFNSLFWKKAPRHGA